MPRAKEKPLYDPATDYEDDTYAWAHEQAELLRRKRFQEADLPNVIEELESLGKEQRQALRSSYRLVMSHLLKWTYQPERRTASWEETIDRERTNIEDRERDSPSLARRAGEIVAEAYAQARREAAPQTKLPLSIFPAACPYSLDQVRDFDWLPD